MTFFEVNEHSYRINLSNLNISAKEDKPNEKKYLTPTRSKHHFPKLFFFQKTIVVVFLRSTNLVHWCPLLVYVWSGAKCNHIFSRLCVI